jgi:hypothetical protein
MSNITSLSTSKNSFFVGQSLNPSCPSPQFEVFESSDAIYTFLDTRSYLTNCGTSTYSPVVHSVDVLSSHENFNIFIVSYCCFPQYDPSDQLCYVQWKGNCSKDLDKESDFTQDFNCLGKFESTTPQNLDSWYYDNSSDSIIFNKELLSCSFGCEPSSLSGFSPDFNNLKALCEIPEPAITETFSPQPTATFTELDFSDAYPPVEGIHIAGDKPLLSLESCLSCVSEVLSKPNSTDKDFRSFYCLTDNGYFYESFNSSLLTELDFLDSSYSFEIFPGKSIFFLPGEFDIDLHDTFLSTLSRSASFNITSFIDLYSDDELRASLPFVSIVQGEAATPTQTETITPDSIIEDKSLILKTYRSEYPTSNKLATVDVDYWLNQLPSQLYSSLPSDSNYLPKIKIIQNSGYIYEHNFSFSSNSLLETISNSLNPDLYLHTISVNGINNTVYFEDKNFNVDQYVDSDYLEFTLEYSFNLNSSLLKPEHSSIVNPIIRKEKFSIFLNPDIGKSHNNNSLNIKSFALDQSEGIKNQAFSLKNGVAFCLER